MGGLRATLCASWDHYRFAALRDPWQADHEGRARPRLAFDGDVAAHQAAEMPADGEAEASAAVFASGRGIRLRKFLEQPAHLLFGHADSGIRDGDHDHVPAIEPLWLRGIVTVPFSVNLLALLAKLSSACRNRVWSAC